MRRLHDDLPDAVNDAYHRILIDPIEFDNYIDLVWERCYPGDAIHHEAICCIFRAMWRFVKQYEDDMPEAMSEAIADALEAEMPALDLRKHGGYPLRSFTDYASACAIEDALVVLQAKDDERADGPEVTA